MLETLLKYLTWPAVALVISLVFVLVFRSRIAALLDRIYKLKIPGGTELDLNEAEVKTIAKEADKNAALAILKDMQRYGQYMSREQAFATASSWVDNYLEENDKEAVKVELSIMVVGMVYSWRGFLSKIPAWLSSHPTATFEAQVLLVDSDYLSSLPICISAEN